jgi:hypothetical protein
MKKFLTLSFAAYVAISLASCLKDKDYDDKKVGLDLSEAPKVVELAGDGLVASATGKNLYGTSVNFTNQVENIVLGVVRLAAAEPAPQDVVVEIDTTGSQAIIDSISPSVTRMPLAIHSINTRITIPKGQREAPIVVKANPTDLGLTATFGIGFRVKSISVPGYVVSGNFAYLLGTVAVKNAYDGKYRLNGYSLRAGDATLTGFFNGASRNFVTISATGVDMGSLPWGSGTGGASPGGIAIGNQTFSVDPVTNGIIWGGVGGSSLVPGYPHRYVPSTRTFYFSVTWGAGPSARLSIDTCVYTGPR